MRQRTKPHHCRARQPLAENWIIENRIIAEATSRKTSSTPSSTIPPAIPNTPERNELTMMVTRIRARTGRDIAAECLAQIQRAVYRSIVMAGARVMPVRFDVKQCGRLGAHLAPLAGRGRERQRAGEGDSPRAVLLRVPL